MKKILVVFGTRPEAIKMAPLVLELSKSFETRICITGQHREMLDQVIKIFNLDIDYDLDVMKENQDLTELTSSIILSMKPILLNEKPNLVLVHGDTTTSVAAALASFYHQIKVGHVEAGLRTGNIYSPFPEELNRQIVSRISNFHFAPTENAKTNLINENISEDKIFVTGNTVIDALLSVVNKVRKSNYSNSKLIALSNLKKIILVTGHRRENFGNGLMEICFALKELSEKYSDLLIIYPVHLNPNVQRTVNKILSSISNIYLIDPLSYLDFIKLMDQSYIILTDSGGIQEEAPSLGKPVLVMRDTTERPEAIKAGTALLVGSNRENIVSAVSLLIEDIKLYQKMSNLHNPYGDGKSSKKINNIIKELEL